MDNDTWRIVIRKPVKREGSSQYLVLVLVSFALSVSVTRLFLSASNYPQIGSGELHIAHVLWGGLLLFIAALIPLLISNRRAYRTAAILSGVGVGLFIDEVGKFITQKNDYFYPAAAPIIYIFFILTVMVFLQTRRREETTARAELCKSLEMLQDWIYYPINQKDQAILYDRLDHVQNNADDTILANLAGCILSVIKQDQRPAPAERPPRWELYIKGLDRWFSERSLRILLAIGSMFLAYVAFKNPIDYFFGSSMPASIRSIFFEFHSGRWFGSEIAPQLYQARVVLEVILGSLFIAVCILLFRNKARIGVPLGFGAILVYLGTIDMLLFYFEQFSTILFVLYQLLLLLGLIYYRTRFLPPGKTQS